MTHGLIQPIVLDENGTLIAGGRRKSALQAIINAALPDDDIPSSIHPTIEAFIETGTLEENVHFRQMLTFDGSTLSTLELEENLQRENLTWQETTLGIARVHQIKTREATLDSKSWGVRETAKLLGPRFSKSHVNYVTRVAKLLNAGDKEIWACENLTSAWRLITARKANEAATKFAEINTDSSVDISQFEKVSPPTQPSGDAKSSSLNDDVLNQLFGAPTDDSQPRTVGEAITASQPERPIRTIDFSSRFLNCKMEDAFDDESVDHIITDPPYAIEMDHLSQGTTGMKNIDNVAHTHDVQSNLNDLPVWIDNFYRILRDGGFCIFWCDFEHFNHCRMLAEKSGFKTQRWPLIWVKTHTCKNQAATKNFTKTVECAVLCRKGNAVLAKPQHTCVHTASNEAERKQFHGHPFVKPFTLWRWLANAVAIPGQTICDPFVGTGSMPYALLTEGFKVVGSEMDTNHYNQLREKLTELYARQFPGENVRLV